MLFQKIQAALFSLFIIPFVLPLVLLDAFELPYWQSVLVYALFALPVVFLYGTTMSLLSYCRNTSAKRRHSARNG